MLCVRGIDSTFQQPAIQSIIPQLVPKDQLVKTNGWMQLLNSGSFLLGPVIGASVCFLCTAIFVLPIDDKRSFRSVRNVWKRSRNMLCSWYDGIVAFVFQRFESRTKNPSFFYRFVWNGHCFFHLWCDTASLYRVVFLCGVLRLFGCGRKCSYDPIDGIYTGNSCARKNWSKCLVLHIRALHDRTYYPCSDPICGKT